MSQTLTGDVPREGDSPHKEHPSSGIPQFKPGFTKRDYRRFPTGRMFVGSWEKIEHANQLWFVPGYNRAPEEDWRGIGSLREEDLITHTRLHERTTLSDTQVPRHS